MEKTDTRRPLIIVAAALLLAGTLFATCGAFYHGVTLVKWYAFSAGSTLLALASCIAGRFRGIKIDGAAAAILAFMAYLAARQIIDGSAYLHPALTGAAIVLFLSFLAMDNDDRRTLITMIIALCTANALLMILQFAGIAPRTAGHRVTGMLDNPAGAALCTAVALPFCLARALKAKGRPRAAYASAFLLMAAAIFLSDSRCGILCVLATVFQALVIRCPERLRKRILRIGATICVIAFVSLCFYKKNSTSGRTFIWRNCISLAAEKPLLGHGAESFGREYMPEQAGFFKKHPDSSYAAVADNTKRPFNEVLGIQVEYGLVGTLLLLLAAIMLIRKMDWKKEETMSELSFFIFAMFSYPSSYPFAIAVLLFCIAGITTEGRILSHGKAVAATLCALALLCAGYTVKDAAFEAKLHKTCTSEDSDKDVKLKQQYAHWNGNPEFMNQFVREFTRRKDYDAVNIAFKRLKEAQNDYQITMMEAENFLRQGMIGEAAAGYAEAHAMIPARFEPLFHLMVISESIGRHADAVTFADEILKKEIKVPSAKVDGMRREAARIKENGHSEF